MKKSLLVLVLLLVALVMAGCAAQTTYPEAGQSYQADPLTIPTATPVPREDTYDLPEDYDPASEEDDTMYDLVGVYFDEYGRQIYAGATPIPLDPIDLPTPRPGPAWPLPIPRLRSTA